MLNVNASVEAEWKSHRQLRPRSLESFGVMIGTQTENVGEYWIEEVTTPYSNDTATRSSFRLRDKRHQKAVDRAFESSNGSSIYIGTWHTHPEGIPTPSSVDKTDWLACIRRNPGRKIFFAIVGTREVRIFVKDRFGFVKLRRGA